MTDSEKPSQENLVESGVIDVESLHPGGMVVTEELADLARQAGLVDCESIDRSELIPVWTRSSTKDLGRKGKWNIAKTVNKRWGLNSLMTGWTSRRIFFSKYTGYEVTVGLTG